MMYNVGLGAVNKIKEETRMNEPIATNERINFLRG
jgi:hypothetical protein